MKIELVVLLVIMHVGTSVGDKVGTFVEDEVGRSVGDVVGMWIEDVNKFT